MTDFIEWHPNYSVGVATLDGQHKKVVGMINKLLANPDVDVRSETVSDVLGELTAFAFEHFREEERLLEEHGYPGLPEHKEEHRAFRRKVVDLCRAATSHAESVPSDLLEFIGRWWIEHVLASDMRYSSFLEERGVT